MLKYMRRIDSIKYKYTITILILFMVFTAIIIYLWYSKTTEVAEKSAVTYVSKILKNSNDNFEVALKDINGIVASAAINQQNVVSVLSKRDYASDKELFEYNRKMEDFMANLYTFKYYINAMLITDLWGREFKSGPILGLEEMKTQAWYNDIINSDGKQVFIPPHYYDKYLLKQNGNKKSSNDDVYDNKVISIAKPVMDGETVIGLVVVDIRCRILKDIFNVELDNEGTFLLFDNNTQSVIFNPEADKASISPSKAVIEEMSNKFTSKMGHFYETINGQDYLVIYNHSEYTNWTSVGLIPNEKLLSSFIQVRETMLYVSIVFVILCIGVIYFISHLLTVRIYKLNVAMKNFDKVDIAPLSEVKKKDEIGELYHQFNSMIERINNLVNEIKVNEREKRRAQVKVLQAQINPHFLYNTLNTIKFLATLQHADNIREVTEALSVLLYINMESRDFITIQEEIKYLKCYLNIQEYKYSNKFTYEIIVEEDLFKLRVLKLLLQPIVENSLKHGIDPSRGIGVIIIKIFREDNSLKVKIQDNGVGMSEETILKLLNGEGRSKSIGISNVISRIKMNFGGNYGIKILSQENLYTTVEITLPIITDEEVTKYA